MFYLSKALLTRDLSVESVVGFTGMFALRSASQSVGLSQTRAEFVETCSLNILETPSSLQRCSCLLPRALIFATSVSWRVLLARSFGTCWTKSTADPATRFRSKFTGSVSRNRQIQGKVLIEHSVKHVVELFLCSCFAAEGEDVQIRCSRDFQRFATVQTAFCAVRKARLPSQQPRRLSLRFAFASNT